MPQKDSAEKTVRDIRQNHVEVRRFDLFAKEIRCQRKASTTANSVAKITQ
jgi:hypothetical protein